MKTAGTSNAKITTGRNQQSPRRWVQPPEGNIPIYWRGRNYNPDFIVETADRNYLIEVKRRKEIGPPMDVEVKKKAIAALRWCQAASGIPGGKPWEYKLIPDDAIDAANDLRFTVSLAHRFSESGGDLSE